MALMFENPPLDGIMFRAVCAQLKLIEQDSIVVRIPRKLLRVPYPRHEWKIALAKVALRSVIQQGVESIPLRICWGRHHGANQSSAGAVGGDVVGAAVCERKFTDGSHVEVAAQQACAPFHERCAVGGTEEPSRRRSRQSVDL